MKRYDVAMLRWGCESETGRWVSYEDAEAAIEEALKAERKESAEVACIELAKLREQNRRLKAAIARARKCPSFWAALAGQDDATKCLATADVQSALRLRK